MTRRSNLFGFEKQTVYHRRPQEERKERERQTRESNRLKAQLQREELAEERARIKADRVRLAREKQEAARAKFEAKRERAAQEKKTEKREASAYTHVPGTSEIEAAYKRGARTLKEAISMAGGRTNPKGSKGKFARCVKAVSKRGGAVDPRAVCGAMEKKYRGNQGIPLPPDPRRHKPRNLYSAIVYLDGYDVGNSPAFTSKSEARTWAKRYISAHKARLEPERRRSGKFSSQIIKNRANPAAGAISAYEEFHGRKPDEFVTVKRQIHIHRHLAGAGQLRKMKVKAIDGKNIVTLSRFGKALLAFNESKNQLFIEGGSQSVDLKAFGIRTQHEVETLGKVTMLDYFTRKDHLGSEGGTAVYRHKFRTVNEDGRPVTVKILRYPDLIYFVREEHLVFSGGDYEILAEGIDK